MKTKQSSGLFRMQNYLTWIVYGVVVLVIATLQMSPHGFPVIAFARPVPLVLFTVCVAMLEGPAIGSIIGMIAGLLWDLYVLRIFGFYGLMLLCIGLVVGLLVQWLLRANFLSAVLLCIGGVVTYTLLDWLLCYVLFLKDELGAVLVRIYLPNALYTILLSPLMYWLILMLARFLRRQKNR